MTEVVRDFLLGVELFLLMAVGLLREVALVWL